jgi:hypothetical protein
VGATGVPAGGVTATGIVPGTGSAIGAACCTGGTGWAGFGDGDAAAGVAAAAGAGVAGAAEAASCSLNCAGLGSSSRSAISIKSKAMPSTSREPENSPSDTVTGSAWEGVASGAVGVGAVSSPGIVEGSVICILLNGQCCLFDNQIRKT